MPKRHTPIYLVVPLLIMVLLACGPCNLLSGEVPTPPHPLAVSTESAGQLESRIKQNLTGESDQAFILRMTDAEVTSLVATELAKYDESPVVDPQIWFTKGKIYGTGRLVNVLPIETDFLWWQRRTLSMARLSSRLKSSLLVPCRSQTVFWRLSPKASTRLWKICSLM